MTLLLKSFSERFDAEIGKIMRFVFQDVNYNHYLAVIPEASEYWPVWYELLLGHKTTSKEGAEIRVDGMEVKRGTVQILPESKFKIEVIKSQKTFTPHEVAHADISRKDWQ